MTGQYKLSALKHLKLLEIKSLKEKAAYNLLG